uniref:Uncharacterized protein n=1 Tax=Populus alba TaxID=43335 RepID=A0A4U5R2Y5_POPAL|nr:hypothetical protein D5086_0000007020 [Populus alba]
MEGFLPSSMEDDVNFTSNQFDFQSLLSELELLSPPPEVPVNQSSISCNDQGGQNNVINDSIQQTTPFPTSFPETMTGHRYTTPNATTSQHGEFNQSGPSSPAPWDQQLTNYQLPMRNQVPAMLPGPQPPMNQRLQYSNMTPNATTSQHGGFNQPGPSFPAPRIQFPSNQGQIDQAAVIPDIDNMQQENFLRRNSGNSTRY